ncbi:MAG: hypothetical protein ABR498_06780 [Candidatus Dormibacteria bacterium]
MRSLVCVLGVAAAACGGSSSASPSPAASSGPLQGGVQLLTITRDYHNKGQNLINNRWSMDVMAMDLAASQKDAGAYSDLLKTFDSELRSITFPNSVSALVRSDESDDQNELSLLMKMTASASWPDYQALLTEQDAADRKALKDNIALESALDAASVSPSKHFGDGLPAIIDDSLAAPGVFQTEMGQLVTGAHYAAQYQNGAFVINVDKDIYEVPAMAQPRTLTAASVAATVTSASGVDAQLFCDMLETGSKPHHAYDVTVDTAAGFYNVAYDDFDSNSIDVLAGGSSAAIRKNGGNDLRLDCVGGYLTVFINGQPELQTYDTRLTSGSASVGAVAGSATGGEVVFTHFTLKGS